MAVIEDFAKKGESVDSIPLARSFSLRDLTTGLREDDHIIASFLYYLGLVTHASNGRLRIPNLAIRKMFLDRLLYAYLPQALDFNAGYKARRRFFETGDIQPVVDFFNQKLLPVLSNRDRGSANELVLKSLLLATLFDEQIYQMQSELEVNKGYADLCLIRRPDQRARWAFDGLFELKWIPRKAFQVSGASLREMPEAELRTRPPVMDAFKQANAQLKRYATEMSASSTDLNLKCFALVAVGLDRVLAETIEAAD